MKTKEKPKLKFGAGNAKLNRKIATFSLPAGHSCPFARDCLSKAGRGSGKIRDGKHTQFRCFAASQEATYPNVRENRWHNLDIIKGRSVNQISDAIRRSLPVSDIVRVHVSGDFFSQVYFDAWIDIARNNPMTIFYAYTKALRFWVARLDRIPTNFKLIASRGGREDYLIDQYGLRCAEVVFSQAEAVEKGLEIDHDDSLAIYGTQSFALLLHGTQPKGSEAAKAWASLKYSVGGYSKKRQT